MIKAPIGLQDLRRRIYRKAKSEKTHRFWGLFGHIAKEQTLREAYRQAKRNGGAPGIDGQRFADIEAQGLEEFLAAIRDDLLSGRYEPQPNRAVEIPKDNGKGARSRFPGRRLEPVNVASCPRRKLSHGRCPLLLCIALANPLRQVFWHTPGFACLCGGSCDENDSGGSRL